MRVNVAVNIKPKEKILLFMILPILMLSIQRVIILFPITYSEISALTEHALASDFEDFYSRGLITLPPPIKFQICSNHIVTFLYCVC